MTEEETTTTENQSDWNEVLFQTANTFHLHQDNVRWSLTAGFGAFFAAGVTLLHQPEIPKDLNHVLELLLAIVGTLWFFVVQIEGWYYNLAVAYLVACERSISRKQNLIPMVDFDRSKVKSFHPSFVFVLLFISCANAYHVFQCTLTASGNPLAAWVCTATYFCSMLYFIFYGRVPQRLDATQ